MNKLDQLMDLLGELHERLSHQGGQPGAMNLFEAYKHFYTNSQSGRQCTYARKCQTLFLQKDYEYIKEKIEEIYKLITSIEQTGKK